MELTEAMKIKDAMPPKPPIPSAQEVKQHPRWIAASKREQSKLLEEQAIVELPKNDTGSYILPDGANKLRLLEVRNWKRKHDPTISKGGTKKSQTNDPTINKGGAKKSQTKHDPTINKGGTKKSQTKHDPTIDKGGAKKSQTKHDPTINKGGTKKSQTKHDPTISQGGTKKSHVTKLDYNDIVADARG
jgi:hypothetical protein